MCRISLQMFYFFVNLRTNCAQMEVANRYSIAFKGLKNGTYDFAFDIDRALFEAFESPEIKDGACRAEVRMERGESLLTLDVAIGGHVVVACDRCLEDCEVPIDYSGRLAVRISDEEHEYDGETLWLHPCDAELDLAQYLYESIVLSLPYQRVHPEGGCDPAMTERFRVVSEQEFSELEARIAEERKGGEWAKLAALRDAMAAESDADPANE